MADSASLSTIIGCVGLLCLAVYWSAMFFPQVANILPDSSFGKCVVFGVFLAGFTVVHSCSYTGFKVVVSAVGAAAATLWNIYIHLFRVIG
jgi:hypothetical protein